MSQKDMLGKSNQEQRATNAQVGSNISGWKMNLDDTNVMVYQTPVKTWKRM